MRNEVRDEVIGDMRFVAVFFAIMIPLVGWLSRGSAADLPIPRRPAKVETRRTYEKPPAYDRNFVAATPKPIDRPAGMP